MLLAGVRGGWGLPSSVSPESSCGVQSRGGGVFTPLQTRGGWGRQLCHGPSPILQDVCVFEHKTLQLLFFFNLEKFYFFGEILDPWASPSGEGMRDSTLAMNEPPTQMSGLKTDLQTKNVWKDEEINEGVEVGDKEGLILVSEKRV